MRHLRAIFLAISFSGGMFAAGPGFWRQDIRIAGQFGNLGFYAQRMAVADFNQDGRPDLLIANFDGVDVLLNTGDGRFAPAVHTADTNQSGPVAVADLNRDGYPDLIRMNGSNMTSHVLLGRGDGRFDRGRDIPGAAIAAAGDFNGDGRMDLVANDGGSMRFLAGNGDGTFAPGQLIQMGPAISEVSQIETADLNNDGKPDVIVNMGYPWSNFRILALIGNGNGTFRGIQTVRGSSPTLVIADVNGDGVLDLISGYTIAFGTGDGTFRNPQAYFTGDGTDTPVAVAAADFDGDGQVDIAAGGRYLYGSRNRVSIFRGNGDGTMLPPQEYRVGWDPNYGFATDLDGDGRPDLVTTNLVSNTLSVLLSAGAGDARRNRAVSAADGTALVSRGSVATLFAATGASGALQASNGTAVERLGGISLLVRDSKGSVEAARIAYVDGRQMNFVIPENVALGEAELILRSGGEDTTTGSMQVDAVAPAIFLAADYSLIPVAILVFEKPDGSRTSQPLFECSGPNQCGPLRAGIGPAGAKSYLVFYGTGFRGLNPQTMKLRIWFEEFAVESVRPVSDAGLDEITVAFDNSPESEFWRAAYVNPMAEATILVSGIMTNRTMLFFDSPEVVQWGSK